MAVTTKIRSTVPVSVIGAAVTVAALGTFVPSLLKAAENKPTEKQAATVKGQAAKNKSVTGASTNAAISPTSGSKRRDLAFYTGDLRANMFSEPVAPAPKETVVKVTPVKPEPVDPLADWSFTGSAKIGSDMYAIVENVTTHDNVMVKAGDDFEGYKVDSVDPKFLALVLGKEPKMMMVSMNSSYVPLSKNAAFLTATPGAQTPGAQMPGGMPGMTMPAGANGMMITLPNGTQISADRAQRYMNRLNSGFGGGGQGGGGGFGGGGFGGGRRGGGGGFGGFGGFGGGG